MLLHFALYLLLINAAAYVAYAVDKRRAQAGEYRISEGTLLGLALVGGTFGAFAARWILRHKTRKEPFRTQFLLIVLLQIILGLILIIPATRAELVRALLY